MITRFLFERMWLLAIVLIAVQVLLIAIWSWRRSRPSARCVWGGFVAIPVLLILSAVVQTPRERIIAAVEEMARCVETEDLHGLGNYLAAGFEAGPYDRATFVEQLEVALSRASINAPTVHGFDIAFPSDGAAVVLFHSGCRIESREFSSGWLPLRWRLTLRRSGGRWLVRRVETIPVAPFHIRSIDALLGRG